VTLAPILISLSRQLERMLRLHFLQQWYGLADGAMEDALYDSQALRGFAGIDLSVAAVPEATTSIILCTS
jgi:transposase, IS5 family